MFQEYLNKIFEKYGTGDASERTYYPVLEDLLKKFSETTSVKAQIIIEAKRTSVGVPDFKVKTDKDLLIGYVEAKDLGTDLDKVDQQQLEKYRKEYPKLIYTNFIEFRLYEKEEGKPDDPAVLIDTVRVSQPITLKLKTPVLDNEAKLAGLLEKFFSTVIPEVYTSKRLAELLAHKTRVIKDLLVEEINLDDHIETSTEELLKVFKQTLIHNLDASSFADMYAQTITFGLFVGRLNSGGNPFNRVTATEYVPKTIPLLRKIFRVLSGEDLPSHIKWHVEEIADILAHAKIEKIKEEFFAEGKGRDPIIHFYETFLKEYDPTEREKRGVYYTPEPVVSYIARSINTLLKEKFGKREGFADPSVVVLDPAAGTLTFPAKAIALAKEEFTKKYGKGGWASLVKDHILENFYAFELLMAPYAIGHLKIGLLLEELGYKLSENDRFKLYLTNTLDMEKIKEVPMLLAKEISEESENAYKVKQEIPILVIFGNPPYSGSSENKGDWILKQIEDYKQIEGESLGEKNPKWIQDDYVKFFRFAQWKLAKEEQGVLGFITNHAWLDNPTFRGMRYSLLKTFDEIYVLNLHGSTLKGEKTPEGGKDENVFDIQAGVAITICVKHKDKKEPKVYYSDLWGLREEKYNWLDTSDILSTKFQALNPVDPYYFFVPKEQKGWEAYKTFLKITDIFPVNSVGIVTSRDNFVIDFEKQPLEVRIRAFVDPSNDDEFVKSAYSLKESSGWGVAKAREKLRKDKNWQEHFTKIRYRPFDERFIFYHPAVIERGREEVMRHMMQPNLALIAARQFGGKKHFIAFVTDKLTEVSSNPYAPYNLYPLYVYNDLKTKTLFDSTTEGYGKSPNFSKQFLDFITTAYGVDYEEVFNYIYAILYSDIYRQKYQEFLKIDFPRVPFTKDYKLFQKLAVLGEELVNLHLLKSTELDKPIVGFNGRGDGRVETVEYITASRPVVAILASDRSSLPKSTRKIGSVVINDQQYFGPIDPEVWDYQIGGYQVLNKWLKDRKDRTLSSEEIKTYCKIVTALSKTIEIQKEIDKLYPEVEKSLVDNDK